MGNTLGQDTGLRCRVIGCRQEHTEHLCQLCQKQNSKHFSKDCPKGTELYYGTHIESIKPITLEGFKKSAPNSRLGPGVYFVKSEAAAGALSLYMTEGDLRPTKVVFKCRVNLGKHIKLGQNDSSDWQLDYDSASSMHPTLEGIEKDFMEFCVKDSKNCVVTSIIINEKPIVKNRTMTWEAAQEEIEKIDDENPTLEDIMEIMKSFDFKRQRIRFFTQLRGNIHNSRMPRVKNQKARWLLRRWYMILKGFLTLFYICNCIWSASHLMNYKSKKGVNDGTKNAAISFVVFLVFQGITNLALLALHGIDSLRKPNKIHLAITLGKFLTAFCLEIPMLISQAFAMKIITQQQNAIDQWNDLSWDMALQTQFIFNLILFLTIDLSYYTLSKCKSKWMKVLSWIPCLFFSILVTGFAFTPVHLAQLGWTWFPTLTDFGGGAGQLDLCGLDTNIHNQLNISMGIGTLGIWTWPVLFPVFTITAAQLIFKFNFNAIKKLYLSFKTFLILFNIWNGIWSVQHLFGLRNNQIETALTAFAVFFTLQSVGNLVYIIVHTFLCENFEDKVWSYISISKLLIVIILEMPMITCQAYAMRNTHHLKWNQFNWDVAMQMEFLINSILLIYIDVFHTLEENETKLVMITSFLFLIALVAMIFTPVYIVQIGWDWLPTIKDFGGQVSNNSNGIVGMLYVSMATGVAGLWIWSLVLLLIFFAIICCIYFGCKKL